MPVSGHKDSGTCTDGGQEVGFSSLAKAANTQLTQISHHTTFLMPTLLFFAPFYQFWGSNVTQQPHLPQCRVLYYVLTFFALRQGLYQFLRSPSSSSPLLPRSSPVSMDYSKFGTAASPAVIPDDSDPARWVCDALFTLSPVY